MKGWEMRADARMRAAFGCAATVGAQFIAGKATRDALYLATLDVTTLPAMVLLTAGVSIVIVALCSKLHQRYSPEIVVSGLFAINAVALLVDWGLVTTAPALAARAVYLQISGFGPMLTSGFWLVATDCFDPRTAKKRFGSISAAGTLGGLAGALIAARVAALFGVAAMLPVLAASSLVCAWQVRRLARTARRNGLATDKRGSASSFAGLPRTAYGTIARSSYLRNLAALVVLGTVASTLADYAFKVQAVSAVAEGATLMRFFSLFYAATSLVSLIIQTTSTPFVLEKLGLAAATSSPAGALLLGAAGAMAIPGLPAVAVARGAESVFRGSLFRASYELLYTPVPSSEKRAAKSLIDVGCDRLGDAVGAGLLRVVLQFNPARQYTTILLLTIACCGASLAIARRLSRGYVETLERNLRNWVVELDPADIIDRTTRTIMLHTLPRSARFTSKVPHVESAQHRGHASDLELQAIEGLRSGDMPRIIAILRADPRPSAVLVPHVIALLASDAVAEEAIRALRNVADDNAGAMADALVDARQPFVIRRRLARVLSAGVSQRAADVLMLGLNDLRFEVRFHCARSLAAIVRKSPSVRVEAAHVLNVIRREVAAGKGVWESRRLLDHIDSDAETPLVDESIRKRANHSLGIDGDAETPLVDEWIRKRASHSLAHVFTLLSFILSPVPLQVAFRSICAEDPQLRGTALEYLDSVLPRDIRDALWPFLDDTATQRGTRRSPEEVLADLLRANASIVTSLEDLRQRDERARRSDAAAGA